MDFQMPSLARERTSARPVDFLASQRAARQHSPNLGAAVSRSLDLAPASGTNRYRLQVGALIAELRHFSQHTETYHKGAGRRALLLVPITSEVSFITASARLACPPRVPILFSCDEPATASWPAQSWGLVLDVPRDRVNALASAALGDARRLASIACVIGARRETDGLDRAIEQLIGVLADGGTRLGSGLDRIESALYRALAERLIAQERRDCFLPIVRSVTEAIRVIREDHRRDFNTEALAASVGVTAQTLRKGFRSCLGTSVKAFIQTVRLEWAHATLSSGFDGRSIDAIARDAGFSSAPPFSRAYAKYFGEPPSQTRRRAVRGDMG